MVFSLVASAQIPQTAPACSAAKLGIKQGKLTDSQGIAWNFTEDHSIAYYQGQPYTGIVKACYSNGLVSSKKSYVDGKKDGLWFGYHQDGWLEWEKNFTNGKKDGVFLVYYADGTKASKENYEKGKQQDIQKYFYGNGQLREKYWAEKGKKEGILTGLDLFGDDKYKENYSNGLKHGTQSYYHSKGKTWYVANYVNGVHDDGVQTYYDVNGNIEMEATWKDNRIIEVVAWDLGTVVFGCKLIGKLWVWDNGMGILDWDDVLKVCESLGDGDGWQLNNDELFVYSESLGPMTYEDAITACEALGDGWRMPNNEELNVLYENKDAIGGFFNYYYWSSTEYYISKYGSFTSFKDGHRNGYLKDGEIYVRPVKTFNP